MIRVLVVDDDFMVARIHRGFVERTEGFEVVAVAHDAAQALEAVATLDPDLVLLDVHLPDMNGLDLLARMREVDDDLDVIIISAAREVETVRRALRGGIVNYLIKPFTYDDLRQRLLHYQQAYRRMDQGTETAEQADVDRVFGLGPADAGVRPLPKGFSAETLQLVVEALEAADSDLSATEVGEVVGLARVSARRYLEHLVAVGRARVRLQYGEVGRPQRRYLRR